jgi:hypothetical protein
MLARSEPASSLNCRLWTAPLDPPQSRGQSWATGLLRVRGRRSRQFRDMPAFRLRTVIRQVEIMLQERRSGHLCLSERDEDETNICRSTINC